MDTLSNLSIDSSKLSLGKQNALFLLVWLACFILASVGFTLLDIPIFYAGGIFTLLLGLYYSVTKPAVFLFVITIVRMALDYSSQYVSFRITHGITINLTQLMGISLFLIGIVFIVVHRKAIKTLPLKAPIAAFILFNTATFFYSAYPIETLKDLVRIMNFPLLFFLGYSAIREINDYKNLLRAILVSSIIPCVVALYQYAAGIGISDEGSAIPRIFGTFAHPNVLSLYLSIIVAVSILYYSLFAKKITEKITIIGAIGIYLIILLLTLTRIAWIALFTFLLIFSSAYARKLLIPLLLIPLLLYFFITPVYERVQSTLNPSSIDSVGWRLTLWHDMVYKTLGNQRWFLGYGFNTFPLVSDHFRGNKLGSNEAHNDFIKAFVEGGIVGLTVFIFYLGGTLYGLVKRWRYASHHDEKIVYGILSALCISIIIASATDNVVRHTALSWIFWILLGGSMGAFSIKKKREG